MKFALVTARKAHANQSVESGRDYVEAYFDHGHFAERLATFASVGLDSGSRRTCALSRAKRECSTNVFADIPRDRFRVSPG